MATNEQEPKPGEVWWGDHLHHNSATEIGKEERRKRENPWCSYRVPGKERPFVILADWDGRDFLVAKSFSAVNSKTGELVKYKLGKFRFEREYWDKESLLKEKKGTLIQKIPEKVPRKFLDRRYCQKNKLDCAEFNLLLKDIIMSGLGKVLSED